MAAGLRRSSRGAVELEVVEREVVEREVVEHGADGREESGQ